MKKEIYRDEIFERSQEKILNESLALMQTVLNSWNALNLGNIRSGVELYELCWQSEIPYSEKVLALQTPAEGISPELAEKHAKSVKIPNPAKFYEASERARQNVYTRREIGLFSVNNEGNTVKFVESVKSQIVKARSVYATSEKQENFCLDLHRLIELLNSLNSQTGGKLITENKLSNLFTPPVRSIPGHYDIKVNPKSLKDLLYTTVK